jgi:PleD family two-component response regulator
MNKTILIAVNDIFFYTKLRDALKPLGYQLERARTQDEVAQKAATQVASAIVLNLNDPAIDGLKALETVRKDAFSAHLPALAFANHEEVDTWQRAKALGVTKIVSRNEFSTRTRQLIEEIVAISQQPSAISK